MHCYVHEEISDVVGTCVDCGKFICAECRTSIEDKNYCRKCVEDLVVKNNKKIELLENKKESPMVFMNAGGAASSSSSSSSSSSGHRYAPPYPTNSVLVHIVLFFFTCGIGNVVYFLYIRNKQKQWRMRY
jgi:hypothetical protein